MGCGGSVNKYKPNDGTPGPVSEETLRFLAGVPLFRQLPKDQHGLLAEVCEPRDFDPGEVVVKQGDIGKEFFIIRSGEASVHVAGSSDGGARTETQNLKAGDYFGEKALVHEGPRSATVIAETPLSTLRITRHKFRELGLNEKLHFNRRKGVGKKVQKTKSKEPTKKSAADRLFIGEALKQNENLQVMVALDEERVNHMVDVFWKETVRSGQRVISQDDATADYFYVIQDGLFQVSIIDDGTPNSAVHSADKKPSQERSMKKLKPGASFGEMALLCLAPRSATITALSDSTLWVVDRDNFKRILMKNTDAQVKQQMEYLEGVEILQCLLPSERHTIAEAFLELNYERGEVIFEQGQQGTAFYVLFDGEVVLSKDGEEVAKMSACTRTKTTAFFGEMALLNNQPRTATVKVTSNIAKVLVLDRHSFDMLLGPLEKIIKNAKEQGGLRMKSQGPRRPTKDTSRKRVPIFRDELTRVGLLGCGGFGTVELVEHQDSQQVFALKSMSKGYIVKTGMQTCVMNEKEILWVCDSPFIIRLHAAYNTSQSLQLLLELALGGDLHVTFQRKGLYGSKAHVVFYSAGVICAFQHLHGIKVIYRDLKPENVLLNASGHVKLTDMGLAKVCLGKTYTACGTPDYFAPEMIKQTGHSFPLDWWTLGIFIFELLAGDPPFEASDPMQTYKNICSGIGSVIFPPSCLSAASSLIRGLLDEDPHKRLPVQSGGVGNLERHGFYAGLDWRAFRDLKSDPPYVPAFSGPKDMRNFRARPGDTPPQVQYTDDGTGWDADFASQ